MFVVCCLVCFTELFLYYFSFIVLHGCTRLIYFLTAQDEKYKIQYVLLIYLRKLCHLYGKIARAAEACLCRLLED